MIESIQILKIKGKYQMKYSYQTDDTFEAGFAAASTMSENERPSSPSVIGDFAFSILGFIVLYFILPAFVLLTIKDWFYTLWESLLIANIFILAFLTILMANLRSFSKTNPAKQSKLRSVNRIFLFINIWISYSIFSVLLPLDFMINFGEVQFEKHSTGDDDFFNTLFFSAVYLGLFYLVNLIQVALGPILQMIATKFWGQKLISPKIQKLINRVAN